MKEYILTISKKYVTDWGIWQAVREILQNAFDQEEADPDCAVSVRWNAESGLVIETSTGHLKTSSLILGESEKATGARGKFGEGYKLALLVLIREGKEVVIENGDEMWSPVFKKHDTYGDVELLTIQVEPMRDYARGVKFTITGVTQEEWDIVRSNMHVVKNTDMILEEPDQRSRIYVGGLYVTTIVGLRYGYAFKPTTVRLDRDRGMVDNFSIEYQTSKLWNESGRTDKIYELLKEEVRDVYYCEQHIANESIRNLLTSYVKENGLAIPVSDSVEIKKAEAAGMPWALVPRTLKVMLCKVKTWFIPTTKSPAERIRELVDSHYFDSSVRNELIQIAETLEGGKINV